MTDFFKKYWIHILVIIIVILLIRYFYKKGKSATVLTKPVLDNPSSTSTNNNPVGLNNAVIRQIVDTAFADYDSNWEGFFGAHDGDVYVPIAQMSDTDFGRAYNIWNESYQQSDGKTMIQAIDSLTGWYNGMTDVRNTILQKAYRLGLK